MIKVLFNHNKLIDQQENVTELAPFCYHIALDAGMYHARICVGDLEDEGDVSVHCMFNGIEELPIWVTERAICSREYLIQVGENGVDVKLWGKYVCMQELLFEKVMEVSLNRVIVKTGKNKDAFYNQLSWEGWADASVIYKWNLDAQTDPELITVDGKDYIDWNVKPCANYEYQVFPLSIAGFKGDGSKRIRVMTCDPTKKPVPMSAIYFSNTEEKKMELSWRHQGFVNEYIVYKKPMWGKKKEIGRLSGLVRSLEMTFEDEDIYADRPFQYSVVACSDGGMSESNVIESPVLTTERARQAEWMKRGLVAVLTKAGVFLSWRLFAEEYAAKEAFLLYKNGILLATIDSSMATNYFDENGTKTDLYAVISKSEMEQKKDKITLDEVSVWKHSYLEIPLDKPEPYQTPDGKIWEFTANDASAADLDGDGEYEIILKWDCNGKDNSHKGYSGLCLLDAYKLDGTKLWRINLGVNIRCGAHYTQFLAYDFDGDGKAEVLCKTADGTIDGVGNVIGNEGVDYRNSDGFILEGPEYLSAFDGTTGAVIDTVLYDPQRGNVSEYGDSWGNRVDRFLACAAYLDGVHPSAVFCRGYYDHGRPTNLVAYDLTKDRKLVKRWKFLARWNQNIAYTNQGFHNLAVADVDGDGCDEIIYGACVIDHDGTGLYTTRLGHGDAMHVGRFTADSKGYDYFGIHEDSDCPYGVEARDAGTGEIRFGYYTGRDTTRGLTAKIDPRYPGNQMWSMCSDGLYNYHDGKKIGNSFPKSINFAIWWDGDLLRELFDHEWGGYETCISNPRIYKWNWETEAMDTIFATDECQANNGTKGNPCLQANLFGDWREEIVLRTKDSTALRIYTTTIPTKHRIYNLMDDPIYRLGVCWQNTAYNQPPHTSFYIGPDMKQIPIPKLNRIRL